MERKEERGKERRTWLDSADSFSYRFESGGQAGPVLSSG